MRNPQPTTSLSVCAEADLKYAVISSSEVAGVPARDWRSVLIDQISARGARDRAAVGSRSRPRELLNVPVQGSKPGGAVSCGSRRDPTRQSSSEARRSAVVSASASEIPAVRPSMTACAVEASTTALSSLMHMRRRRIVFQ